MPRTNSPVLRERIGGVIRAWREAAGLTQDELADRLGTTRHLISHYERGSVTQDPNTVDRIARAMGFPPLFEFDPSAESSAPRPQKASTHAPMRVTKLVLSDTEKGVETTLWDGNGRTIVEYFPLGQEPPLGATMVPVVETRWELQAPAA